MSRTDVRLRCLGQSLVTALTSADRRLEVVPGSLYLSVSACPAASGLQIGLRNRFLTCGFLPFRGRAHPRLLSSGTQRTRERLIRRSGHIVQGRPPRSVRWADIPGCPYVTGVVRRDGSRIGSSRGLGEMNRPRHPEATEPAQLTEVRG